jgi:hypothetical protein
MGARFMSDEEVRKDNLEKILHSPSYRLAYQDVDFLNDPRLRPTRMELELLKPDLILQEHNIRGTIVVFGSTRIVEAAVAQRQLEQARATLADTPDDPRPRRANPGQEPLLRSRPRVRPARLFLEPAG